MGDPIPARIFQTWKKKEYLPERFKKWSTTFREKNPKFAYELWDDQDNRKFISEEFPWFLELYDNYPAEIYRADAIRYFYLYMFGGIYADMDTECLKPLDDLLNVADIILGRMGQSSLFAHSIPNAIMASRVRQEFWLLVIELLIRRAKQVGRPESLTGPVLLKTAVDLYSARALSNTNRWHVLMTSSLLEESAYFDLIVSEGKIEGFYSGVCGAKKLLTGTYCDGYVSISYPAYLRDKGQLFVNITGQYSSYSGSGTLVITWENQVIKGTWTAHKSGSQPTRLAIDSIKRRLSAHQQPSSESSKIEILESQKFYAIDWSDEEHQSLRTEALKGELCDEKALLFPDSWMVTYWAHSWE